MTESSWLSGQIKRFAAGFKFFLIQNKNNRTPTIVPVGYMWFCCFVSALPIRYVKTHRNFVCLLEFVLNFF